MGFAAMAPRATDTGYGLFTPGASKAPKQKKVLRFSPDLENECRSGCLGLAARKAGHHCHTEDQPARAFEGKSWCSGSSSNAAATRRAGRAIPAAKRPETSRHTLSKQARA